MTDPVTLERNSDARATPKRIALIRRDEPARVLEDQGELVPTAPHLLVREIILFQTCVVVIAILSLVFDAPLEGVADPLHTPNPAKAPWYFLGLQELLHYFPPVVAGVLLPALAILGIVVIPYVRVNIEIVGLYERPWKRMLVVLTVLAGAVATLLAAFHVWAVLVPTLAFYGLMMLPAFPFCPARLKPALARVPLADWIMHWFVAVVLILTLIGILFRGPGWSLTWPWRDGIY